MPQLPVTEGPSVGLEPVPSVRQVASPAAGAGAMLQADRLGQVSRQFADYAQQQQNKRDLDAVFRAETARNTDYLQQEQSELAKNGNDAIGSAQRMQSWWQENVPKYEEGLTDRQLFAFRRSTAPVMQGSLQTMARHEHTQTNVALSESAQAKISTAIDAATADPSADRVENSRKDITEAVGLAGNAQGWAPEVRDSKLAGALTLMHRGVVMQLLDSEQPDQAKAYFDANKGEINGDTQLVLEKALQHGGMLGKAQTAADDIMSKFTDVGAASDYIEKNYHGEEQQAVRNEVEHRFTIKQKATSDIALKAYGTAELAVSQGQRVPESVWAQMDDGHRAAIVERQKAEQKRAQLEAQGKDVKTDFATYDSLNTMAVQQPAAFQSLDLSRYADRLSRADLEKFSNLKRETATAEGIKGLATRDQQIQTTVASLKLDGAKNDEARGALVRSLNDAIDTEQAKQGRPLKYKEIQQAIDDQVLQMTVPGPWYTGGDTDKRFYQLTPEERATAMIKVPDADRTLIIQALRAKGRPVTEQAISDLYQFQRSRARVQ